MRTSSPSNNRERHSPAAAVAAFSPLYRQVRQLIIDDLRAGVWRPGELIPSEQELAARHGVSQGTVRKAIEELAALHLLVRQQGKGTFVASHHSPRSQFRFLSLRRDDGEPLVTQSEVLACRRARPPNDIARRLLTRSGESAIHVRRLLTVNAAPAVLDDIWLSASRFRGLSAERLSAYDGPLYGLFETEFDTRMIRADEQLRAVEAPVDVASALKVEPGIPLLLVERCSYTFGDLLVEVRKGYCLTRHFHYFNELNK